MTIEQARGWVIKASLISTLTVFAFLLVSPALDYPLDSSAGDVMRLMEILIPVFIGYLAAGSHFVFRHQPKAGRGNRPLPPNAKLLIQAPLWVFAAMCAIAFTMYGVTNSRTAEVGTGWSVDMLAGILTLALGLLTATTHLAVAYLFESDAPTTDQS